MSLLTIMPSFEDELFGFVVGGFDTTSTTMCWALKYLTAYPDVQEKLRSLMRQEFAEAYADGRLPSMQEITKAHMPYFDAAVHEIHRCGNVLSSGARKTVVDVVVLGCHIPKGTDVFTVRTLLALAGALLMLCQPSFSMDLGT